MFCQIGRVWKEVTRIKIKTRFQPHGIGSSCHEGNISFGSKSKIKC